MSEEKYNKMWPHEIIKYGILPFVEPSCEIISKNGDRCGETWSFKSKSGKTVDCHHYCLNHITEWIENLKENTYQLIINDNKYDFKVEVINISGIFNDDKYRLKIIKMYNSYKYYNNDIQILKDEFMNILTNMKIQDIAIYSGEIKVRENDFNLYYNNETKPNVLVNNEYNSNWLSSGSAPSFSTIYLFKKLY